MNFFIGFEAASIAMALSAMMGCSPASTANAPDNASFEFDPLLRNVIVQQGEDGQLILPRPNPPKGLRVVEVNGAGALEWTIPATYLAADLKTGFLVFVKKPDVKTGKVTWNWTRSSEDWELKVATLEALKACSPKTFLCTFSSPELQGKLGFAIYTKWDVSIPIANQGVEDILDLSVSDPTTTEGIFKGLVKTIALDATFIDLFVSSSGSAGRGRLLSSGDFKPTSLVDIVLPSFLVERGMRIKSQATINPVFSYEPNPELIAATERPFHAARSDFSPGSKTLYPDLNNNRALISTDSTILDACAGNPDPLGCASRIGIANSSLILGQTMAAGNSSVNAIRSFRSSSMSWGRGVSGQSYTFVADKSRILVRIGEFFGCTEEEKNSEDALKCGFQISIGTRSPRLTVPEIPPGFNFLSYRQSLLSNIYTAGFQANATRCLTWDSDCALRDDVPPTSSSLRYPSAPFLYNNTLYIPDTGNARVVTIEQFEQRIQACGRLKPLTDAEDGSCVFDRVLGPNNFTERDCIRGGERFFNPATLSSTSYPAHGIYALVGSVACRQDQHISLDAGRAAAGLFDRDLPVVDFGDAILSDLSLSGALMERTRQTFRAPTKIRVSQDGRLYVMDSGYSYIVSGPNAATLPPRLMIWTTNPMTGETPCRAEGCAADFVVGPPSVQSTFVHKASEELWHNIWPSGGFPISDFEIIPSGNAKGLWFVTGVDPRLIYVADPSKLSLAFNPANFRVFNNRTLPYTEEPFHRRGALSGIVATPDGRIIMASDPLQNTYFTWTLQGVSLK